MSLSSLPNYPMHTKLTKCLEMEFLHIIRLCAYVIKHFAWIGPVQPRNLCSVMCYVFFSPSQASRFPNCTTPKLTLPSQLTAHARLSTNVRDAFTRWSQEPLSSVVHHEMHVTNSVRGEHACPGTRLIPNPTHSYCRVFDMKLKLPLP